MVNFSQTGLLENMCSLTAAALTSVSLQWMSPRCQNTIAGRIKILPFTLKVWTGESIQFSIRLLGLLHTTKTHSRFRSRSSSARTFLMSLWMHSRCFFLLYFCFFFSNCTGVRCVLDIFWCLFDAFFLHSSRVLCRKKAACCTFFLQLKHTGTGVNYATGTHITYFYSFCCRKKHCTVCGVNGPLEKKMMNVLPA